MKTFFTIIASLFILMIIGIFVSGYLAQNKKTKVETSKQSVLEYKKTT